MKPVWEKNSLERDLHHGGNLIVSLAAGICALGVAAWLIFPEWVEIIKLVIRIIVAGWLVVFAFAAFLFAAASLNNWTKSPQELKRKYEEYERERRATNSA